MIKLPEEEIYRVNLLVKKCLLDISTCFLQAPESHFIELNTNAHYKILSFHDIDNMEILVRKWYQKHTRIIGKPPLHRFSQFSFPINSLPYDLETIQFYMKKMAHFYFNSFVIQCIEVDKQPEAIEPFLSNLFPCILERIYWLARTYNKNNLANIIAEKFPIFQKFESLIAFLDSALLVGDFEAITGILQQQIKYFPHYNQEEKIKISQEIIDRICRYGRLFFFEKIRKTLQENNLLQYLRLEKTFAHACRSGEIFMIKAVINLIQSQHHRSSLHLTIQQIRNNDPLYQVCLSGQIDALNFLLSTLPSHLLPIILNDGARYYLEAAISSKNLDVFHKMNHILPKSKQHAIFSKANFIYESLKFCPVSFLAPIFEKIPPEYRESILYNKSYLNLLTILLSHQCFDHVQFLLLKLPEEKRKLVNDQLKYNIEKNRYARISTKSKKHLFDFLDDCLLTHNQEVARFHRFRIEVRDDNNEEAQISSSDETASEVSSIISSNFEEDSSFVSETESDEDDEQIESARNPRLH